MINFVKKCNFNIHMNEEVFLYDLNEEFHYLISSNNFFNYCRDFFRVEFDSDKWKKNSLLLNENFKNIFCYFEDPIIENKIIKSRNFDVLKISEMFNRRILNEEFKNLFSHIDEDIPVFDSEIKNRVCEDDFVESFTYSFNVFLNNKSIDKRFLNESFKQDFDDNFLFDNLIQDNLIKAIEIDLNKRNERKNQLNQLIQTNKIISSDDLFPSATKIKSEVKEELSQETKLFIDEEILKVKNEYTELYSDILNVQINSMQKNHQHSLEIIKNEYDRKIDKISQEFDLFRKMMAEQMSGLKNRYLSAVSGGGSINILDMQDVDPSKISNGRSLVWNAERRIFELEFIRVEVAQSYEVTDELLQLGYITLKVPANPEYYSLSSLELNGLLNYHELHFDFIDETTVDISRIGATVGDFIRIIYTKK